IARIARRAWFAGTRASQLTYENSPSLRSSPPRIPIPSTSLYGILESAMPHQGKRLFPQPVKLGTNDVLRISIRDCSDQRLLRKQEHTRIEITDR
ncbi:hypothetical protein, partial [Novosphingobium guangzhouense]|uniref:hypothetical protein n=1 Tax=Novosphingobium guangzhouense TaxID=1850347 RepID=UPI001B801036